MVNVVVVMVTQDFVGEKEEMKVLDQEKKRGMEGIDAYISGEREQMIELYEEKGKLMEDRD